MVPVCSFDWLASQSTVEGAGDVCKQSSPIQIHSSAGGCIHCPGTHVPVPWKSTVIPYQPVNQSPLWESVKVDEGVQ